MSNHGARQLDTTPATIEVLGEVVAAVRGAGSSVEVYLDGGIMRGTDVLKVVVTVDIVCCGACSACAQYQSLFSRD